MTMRNDDDDMITAWLDAAVRWVLLGCAVAWVLGAVFK